MAEFSEIKVNVLKAMNQVDTNNIDELRKAFDAILDKESHGMTTGEQEQFFLTLVGELWDVAPDDVMGLGVLEDILQDPDVMEIMVNGLDGIYIEKHGRLQRADVNFSSNAEIMRVINNIAIPVGRKVDESHPIVDIRLADGTRVNIVVPPIALNGPVMTIRKMMKMNMTWDNLVNKYGSLTEPMRQFLEACVQGRINIVVGGGTGSGKTTILNGLTEFISENERIITVEPLISLDLKHPHVVKLEARPANLEGRGEVSMEQLVDNAMKMRPDRIIVSEVHGAETWGILTAMSTGHDGSMFTIHADSVRDTIMRIDSMVTSANPSIPVLQVRGRIANAIQIIVQQTRLADGTRKITNITEVVGVRNGMLELRDIFEFEQTGFENGRIIGKAHPTGVVPDFVERLRLMGIDLPESVFEREE